MNLWGWFELLKKLSVAMATVSSKGMLVMFYMLFIIDNDSLKESKALKYIAIQKMIFIASLVLS